MLKSNPFFLVIVALLFPLTAYCQDWRATWDSLLYYDNFLQGINPYFIDDSDSAMDAFDMHWHANDRYPALIFELWKNKEFNIDSFSQLDFAGQLVSSDGKLYIFQFPENSGGTYEPWIAFYGINGDGRESGYFPSDYYYQLLPNVKSYYVLHGYVKGCTSCFGESLSVYQLLGDSLVEKSSFEISGRGWDDRFIQLDSNTFKFRYKHDDMTSVRLTSDEELIVRDFSWSWEELEEFKNEHMVWPADSGYFHIDKNGNIKIDSWLSNVEYSED